MQTHPLTTSIFVGTVLFALSASSAAQSPPLDCLPQGVQVSVSPNPAQQGEPVTVQMTNDSEFVILLPSTCLFSNVRKGSCNGPLVSAPFCFFTFTFVPPGGVYSTVWDQKDLDGNPLPPGVYGFILDFPTDCCPTVVVEGTCTDPPVEYGAADQGTGDYFPTLVASGFPVVGNNDFGYRLTAGLGGTFAVLLVGFGEAQIPLDWGTLWIDPFLPIVSVSGVLTGEPGKGGVGEGTFGLPIPPDPMLAQAQIFAQMVLFDPASDGSLSHSNAIRARICP